MIVEEYEAKSLVRTARTSLFSWSELYLNPYQGCYHDCKYCDGKAEGYYMHDDFADRVRVKKNAPQLLENYIKKLGFIPINRKKTSTLIDHFPELKDSASSNLPGKSVIFIGGGVTDVYQPVEEKVRMTRKLLQIAYDYKFPVFILTKNNLVLRDLDLLKKINEESYVCASFTITLADEEKQKIFEPRASTTNERFEAVKILREEGIHSGVYCYPSLPFIGDTDENILGIYTRAKEVGAEFVYCMGLTLKPGKNKVEFMKTLQNHFPELFPKYKLLYGNENKYGALDREQFKKMALIWPEIKGYKFGYELNLDYTSKRYVPEGRITSNLEISEILHRIAYLKSFFIKSSSSERKELNEAATFFITSNKDISKLSDVENSKLSIGNSVRSYVEEYLSNGKSKSLEELEKQAYDSVCEYLTNHSKL